MELSAFVSLGARNSMFRSSNIRSDFLAVPVGFLELLLASYCTKMAADFSYHPLATNEIRLLRPRLVPPPSSDESSNVTVASTDGEIRGDVQHFPLNDCPLYAALSYAWGSQGAKTAMTLNDETFNVSLTAEAALRQLYLEGLHQWFWVDQICINQEDPVEKGVQVQMMRSIYSNASEVVAWMGLVPHDDPKPDVLKWFADHLEKVAETTHARDYDALVLLHDKGDEILPVISDCWQRLCEKSYWTRLWVLQEYAVAKVVRMLWGAASFSHWAVNRAVVLSQDLAADHSRLSGLDPAYAARLQPIYRAGGDSFVTSLLVRRYRYHSQRLEGKGEGDPLINVLNTALVLDKDYNVPLTTDARDRIFSLLPLACDAADFVGFPNYERPCHEIYEEAAVVMLRLGHVDLLGYSQPDGRMPGLPSWAPDWNIAIRSPLGNGTMLRNFRASGETSGKQQISNPAPGRLLIRGFMVDKIASVGAAVWDPNWLEGTDATSAMAYLTDIETLCRQSPRLNEHDTKFAVARIGIADGTGPPPGQDIGQWNDLFYSWYADGCRLLTEALRDGLAAPSLEQNLYLRTMRRRHSLRPFISSTGYVGVCHRSAESGDEICVFFGGNVPFILRPEAGPRQRTFVGEAMVFNGMQGELLGEDREEMEFVLS
jgi:hypothetical protein